MAGATGSDQTGWAGLLKNAEQGNLQLINVDGATLKKLTTGCEDLVIDTMGLIKAIEGIKWDSLLNWTYSNQPAWPKARSHTTTLGSMQMMFTEYQNKSLDLVTILRKHQAIITDMGHTFTAANKRYAIAEGESENSFKLPGGTDLSTRVDGLADRVTKSNPISGGEWMHGPPKPTGGASGVGFDARAKAAIEGAIENAYSLIHFDFANIAELFDRNDGMIWEMAGKWNTVAQVWNSSIQTFSMNLLPTFKEQHWQGAGAERAAAFLDTYLKSANELQDAIDALSKVLAATGDFNLYSWGHLPRYSQFHYEGKEVKDVNNWKAADALAGVRTWWEGKEGGGAKGYVDGVKQLAGMIPVFVDPATRTGGASGDSSGNNGGSGSNSGDNSGTNSGNNGGGNSGSGGGSGSGSGGSKGGGGGDKGGGGSGDGDGGSGSGSGSGGSGGGTGTGGSGSSGSHPSGPNTQPTGNPGQGSGPAAGPSGPLGVGGSGGSGALTGKDLLSLFSEVLQLISSAIPTLVQLGNQLAAQLGPGLQALAKAVEDGTTTVKQALAAATELIEQEIGHVEDLLVPPGATGPLAMSRVLIPGADGPTEPIAAGVFGRAGGNQPETFADFTSTRSTDAVVGAEVSPTGDPGVIVEGDR